MSCCEVNLVLKCVKMCASCIGMVRFGVN
uniref:Uncharacterized protein n=1 Tax=Anguilla anguilla TaxID=7936 RepID=A0A0E9THV1_ANGAN